MRDRRNCERLDVFGDNVIPAKQQRSGPGELNQVEFGARAGTHRDLRVVSGSGGQRHHVAQNVFMYGDQLDRLAHRQQVLGVHNLIHRRLGRTALEAPAQHRGLVPLGEVSQLQPDREPIQLCLG